MFTRTNTNKHSQGWDRGKSPPLSEAHGRNTDHQRKSHNNSKTVAKQSRQQRTSKAMKYQSKDKKSYPFEYQSIQNQILHPKMPTRNVQLMTNFTEIPLQKIDFNLISNINDQLQFENCLKLTNKARQTLQKVQRFDRFIYIREAQKTCKDVITEELKRIEKIKNSNRTMRVKYFDNQLTITTIYNLLKLLNEMHAQNQEHKSQKKAIQEDQRKKRQIKFKLDLENKKNDKKAKDQKQADIRRLIIQIDGLATVKDDLKLIQSLKLIIQKYEHQQSLFLFIKVYKSLLDALISKQSLKKQQKHLNELIKSLSEINKKNISQSLVSLKEQRQNLKLSVESLKEEPGMKQLLTGRQSNSTSKKKLKTVAPDTQTNKLLHNLDNLEHLYDLIINNYENQYEHKRNRRSKLLIHRNKLSNYMGSLSASVLVVDDNSIWGSKISSDRSSRSRSRSRDRSIKRIRMNILEEDWDDDKGKSNNMNEQMIEEEYFSLMEKQINILKSKLDEYVKKQKDVIKFSDKIQQIANKIEGNNPIQYIKKVTNDLKFQMPFRTMNISNSFIKIISCILNDKKINVANLNKQQKINKDLENQVKKLSKSLQRQRNMNDELKKSLKIAEVSLTKTQQFHHPPHSDTQQLKIIQNIEKVIKEGGQWWSRIPRRLKRHSSFEPIYNIIQRLKQRQSQAHKKQQREKQKLISNSNSQAKLKAAEIQKNLDQEVAIKNLQEQIANFQNKIKEHNQQLIEIQRIMASYENKNDLNILKQKLGDKGTNQNQIKIYRTLIKILEKNSQHDDLNKKLKDALDNKNKLESMLEKQKRQNSQLKKSIKVPTTLQQTNSQSHIQQFENIKTIYDKIIKGGQWWLNIPRKLKKNSQFSTIYSIIQILKQKQIQIIKINKQIVSANNSSNKRSPSSLQKLQKQLTDLKNQLEKQKKKNIIIEEEIRDERSKSQDLKKKIKNSEKQLINSENLANRFKQQELEINSLKNQNRSLKSRSVQKDKILRQNNAKDTKIIELQAKISEQNKKLADSQRISKIIQNLSRKTRSFNILSELQNMIKKQKGQESTLLTILFRLFQNFGDSIKNQQALEIQTLKNQKQASDKLLQNQRKISHELKKLKNIPINIGPDSQLYHPTHSDAQQLENIKSIYQKIQQGGQWWKKIPRRLKRHDSFTPVYNIIQMLKNKQLQNIPTKDKQQFNLDKKQRVKSLERTNKGLKNDKDQKNDNQKRLNNMVQKLTRQLQLQQQKNIKMNQLLMQERQKSKRVPQVQNQLRKLQYSLEAEKNKAKNAIQKQKSSENKLNENIQKLQQLQKSKQSTVRIQKSLKTEQNKVKGLNDRIKDLQQQNGLLRKTIEGLQKQNDELRIKQNNSKSEQNRIQQRSKSQQKASADLKKKIEELQKQNNQNKKYEKMLKAEQNKNKILQQEKQKLKQQIDISQQNNAQITKLQKALKTEKQKTQKLSAIQQSLKQQNTQIKQELLQIKVESRYNQLQKSNQQLSNRIKELQKQLTQATKKYEKKEQPKELQQRLIQLQNQNHSLKEQCNQLRQFKQKYDQTEHNQRELKDYYQQQINRLKKQLECSLNQEESNKKHKISKIIQEEAAKSYLEEDLELLKEANKNLVEQNQELKQILKLKSEPLNNYHIDLSQYSIDSNKDISKLQRILSNLQKEWADKCKALEQQRQELATQYQNQLALKGQQLYYLQEQLEYENPNLNILDLGTQTSSILLKPLLQDHRNKQQEKQELEDQLNVLKDRLQRKEDLISNLQEEIQDLKKKIRQIEIKLKDTEDILDKKDQKTKQLNFDVLNHQGEIQRLEGEIGQLRQYYNEMEKDVKAKQNQFNGSEKKIQQLNQKIQQNKEIIQQLSNQTKNRLMEIQEIKAKAEDLQNQLQQSKKKLALTEHNLHQQQLNRQKLQQSKEDNENKQKMIKQLMIAIDQNKKQIGILSEEKRINEQHSVFLIAELNQRDELLKTIQDKIQQNQTETQLLQKQILQDKINYEQNLKHIKEQKQRIRSEYQKLQGSLCQKQNSAKQEILELKEQIERLKNGKSQDQRDIALKDKNIEALKNGICILQKELNAERQRTQNKELLESEMQSIKRQAAHQIIQIQKLKNELNSTLEEKFLILSNIQEIKNRQQEANIKVIEPLKRDNERKQAQIQQIKNQIQSIKDQLADSKENALIQKQQLERAIEYNIKHVKNKDEQILKLKSENSRLNAQLEQLSKQIFDIQSKPDLEPAFKQMKRDIQSKDQFIQSQKIKIGYLQNQLDKLNDLQVLKEQNQSKILSLKRQLDHKQRDIISAKGDLKIISQQNQSLKAQLLEYQNKQDLQIIITQLQLQNQQKQKQIKHSQAQIDSLKNELLKQFENSKNRENIELELQSAIRQLQSKQKQLDSINRDIESIRQQTKHLQMQNHQLQLINAQIQSNLHQNQRQNAMKSKIIQNYKQQLEKLGNQLAKSHQKIENIIYKNLQTEDLERQLSTKQSQMKNLLLELNKYKQAYLSTQKQEDLTYMIDELSRKIEKKQDEINSVKGEVQYEKQLRSTLAEKLEDRRRRVEQAEEQMVDLKIQKIELERQLAKLRKNSVKNEERIKYLLIEISSKDNQIQTKENINSQLEIQVRKHERQSFTLQNKIKSLEIQLAKAQDAHKRLVSDLQDLYSSLQKSKQKNKEVETEKYSFKNRINELQTMLSILQKQNKELQQENKQNERIMRQKTNTIVEIKKDYTDQKERTQKITKNLIEIKQQLANRNLQYENELNNKNRLLKKVENQIGDKNQLQSKLNSIKDNLRQKQMSYKQLENQINCLKREIQKYKNTQKSQKKMLQTLNKQLQNERQSGLKVGSLELEITNLQKQIQRNEKNEKKIRDQCNELQNKLQQKTNIQLTINAKYSQLQINYHKIKRETASNQKQIQFLKEQLKKHENQLITLRPLQSKNGQQQRQKSRLSQELMRKQAQFISIKNQYDELSADANKLRQQNNKLKSQQNLEFVINELKIKISQGGKEIHKQNQKNRNMEDKLQQQAKQFQQQKQSVKRMLERQIGNKDKEIVRLGNQYQYAKKQITKMQEIIRELNSKPDLQMIVGQLKRQVERKQKIIGHQKKSMEKLQQQFEKQRQAQSNQQSLQFKIDSLNKQNDLKNKKIHHLQITIQSHKQIINRVETQLQDYKVKAYSPSSGDQKNHDKQIQMKEKQIEKLNKELKDAMKSLNQINYQLQSLKNGKIILMGADIKGKQRQNTSLKLEIETLRKQLNEKQKQNTDISQKYSVMSNYKFQIDNLKRELRTKEKQIEKKNMKIKYLEEELEEQKSKNKFGIELESLKKKLQSKDKQIQSLKKSISSLENELIKYRNDLNDLKNKQDLEPLIQQLNRELKHNKTLLQNQKKAYKLLEDELDQEKMENLHKNSRNPSEIDSLKRQLESKDRQLQTMRKSINQLEKQLVYQREEIGAVKSKQSLLQKEQLKRQLNHQSKLLEDQKKAYQLLKTQITQQRLQKENIRSPEIDILKRQLQNKQSQISSLKKTYQHLQIQLQQKTIADNSEVLKSQIAELQKKLSHERLMLQKEKKAYQILESELEQERTQRRNNINSETDSLRRQNGSQQRQIQSYKKTIQQLSNQLRKQRSQLNQLRNQHDLLPQIQQLTNQVKHYKKLLEGQTKANRLLEEELQEQRNFIGIDFKRSPEVQSFSYTRQSLLADPQKIPYIQKSITKRLQASQSQVLDSYNQFTQKQVLQQLLLYKAQNQNLQKSQSQIQRALIAQQFETKKILQQKEQLEKNLKEVENLAQWLKLQLQKISPQTPFSPESITRHRNGVDEKIIKTSYRFTTTVSNIGSNIQGQKRCGCEGDCQCTNEAELEVIRKINQEIADLGTINQRLQEKIASMQSGTQNSHYNRSQRLLEVCLASIAQLERYFQEIGHAKQSFVNEQIIEEIKNLWKFEKYEQIIKILVHKLKNVYNDQLC